MSVIRSAIGSAWAFSKQAAKDYWFPSKQSMLPGIIELLVNSQVISRFEDPSVDRARAFAKKGLPDRGWTAEQKEVLGKTSEKCSACWKKTKTEIAKGSSFAPCKKEWVSAAFETAMMAGFTYYHSSKILGLSRRSIAIWVLAPLIKATFDSFIHCIIPPGEDANNYLELDRKLLSPALDTAVKTYRAALLLQKNIPQALATTLVGKAIEVVGGKVFSWVLECIKSHFGAKDQRAYNKGLAWKEHSELLAEDMQEVAKCILKLQKAPPQNSAAAFANWGQVNSVLNHLLNALGNTSLMQKTTAEQKSKTDPYAKTHLLIHQLLEASTAQTPDNWKKVLRLVHELQGSYTYLKTTGRILENFCYQAAGDLNKLETLEKLTELEKSYDSLVEKIQEVRKNNISASSTSDGAHAESTELTQLKEQAKQIQEKIEAAVGENIHPGCSWAEFQKAMIKPGFVAKLKALELELQTESDQEIYKQSPAAKSLKAFKDTLSQVIENPSEETFKELRRQALILHCQNKPLSQDPFGEALAQACSDLRYLEAQRRQPAIIQEQQKLNELSQRVKAGWLSIPEEERDFFQNAFDKLWFQRPVAFCQEILNEMRQLQTKLKLELELLTKHQEIRQKLSSNPTDQRELEGQKADLESQLSALRAPNTKFEALEKRYQAIFDDYQALQEGKNLAKETLQISRVQRQALLRQLCIGAYQVDPQSSRGTRHFSIITLLSDAKKELEETFEEIQAPLQSFRKSRQSNNQ